MKKGFFVGFALNNIKKNAKMMLPYTLTCVLSVLMFYNSINLTMSDTTGTGNLSLIMNYAMILQGLFSVFFLFYTNSFLIKRRKKEFGLYNILGLEKKHISRIVITENTMIGTVSIVLGLALGILFSRMLIFALYRLINFDLKYNFEVNIHALWITIAVFVAIFILSSLANIVEIYRTKTGEMLTASKMADKAPKSNVFFLLIGLLTLGIGYYLAITLEDPVSAVMLFMLAALLVCIGTYFLFSAFSIAVLKALKLNKKFYYKPQNFIAVSGLMHRIKRNAAGLTNICILSTVVIVMVSMALSMYIGFSEMMDIRFSHDYRYQIGTEGIDDIVADELKNEVSESFTGIENITTYKHFTFATNEDFTEFGFYVAVENGIDLSNADVLSASGALINESGYENITGKEINLADDELLVGCETATPEIVNFNGKEYKKTLTDTTLVDKLEDYYYFGMMDQYIFVLSDNAFDQAYLDSNTAKMMYNIHFDVLPENNVTDSLTQQIGDEYQQKTYSISFVNKAEATTEFMALHGTLFFVTIFLGTMLILGVLLIIYYKQVIEGYEDRENYVIMQKIGMENKLVKKSINKQIIMVFLLPIIGAIIHTAVASKALLVILEMFSLQNNSIYFMCAGITVAAFTLIYIAMYYLTSKVYYRIVRGEGK